MIEFLAAKALAARERRRTIRDIVNS